jgi:uncharacterized membrane protein SirB2
MYEALKHTHLSMIVLSIILFQWRFLMHKMRHRRPGKFLRVAPHVIDTVLLATGVVMIVISGAVPWKVSWTLAKLVALLVYILLGMIAMKSRGPIAVLAFVLATLVFAYMVLVAISKSPTPWL